MISFFNSETTTATNYSIRSDAHNLTVQKQDKLALNPFDDKHVYLNPKQSLSWDNRTQKGDCPRIYCLKLIDLYYKELSTSEKDGRCAELRLRDEEIYYNIWTLKDKLNHQDLLNLISDRAHLLSHTLFIIIIYYPFLSSIMIIHGINILSYQIIINQVKMLLSIATNTY